MVDVLGLPAMYFQAFFLIFIRVMAAMGTMPILSSRAIPSIAKVGLSAILAFALTPTVSSGIPPLAPTMLGFVVTIAQEVLIGLVFGFAVQLVFGGLQMAGQVIGIQMGLNIAAAFDPVSQSQQASYIDQLYALLAGLIFLTINGHHYAILALRGSFDIVPLGHFALGEAVSESILNLLSRSFVVSIQLGLPIMAALLVTDVAFLIIGRSAPQMNIFAVGQPLKLGVGLVAFFLALPVMVAVMSDVLRAVGTDVTRLLLSAA